jgi:hypothetical protein
VKRAGAAKANHHATGELNKETRKRQEAVMERLVFVCPNNRQLVDIGIESELQTLLRIRTNKVRARCPSCGQWHEWLIRDAQLAKAA